MTKTKTWKYKEEKPPYEYLQLGYAYHKHVVFELTPDKELNIFQGRDGMRFNAMPINKEQQRKLKEWINKHL